MIIIAGDVNKLLDELGTTMPGVGTLQAAVEFMTKGELGLVTTSGKVAWGKMAQVTNNPELDGCVNSVLLV